MSEQHPTAVVRSAVDRKRRLSLIWAIPIVTLLIGAWLAWHTIEQRGPLVTITFETAEGLQANVSHVRHKDVDMGVVEKVSLTPDLKRVEVTVRMNRESEPLLTEGARFWVVRPRFFAGSISGLQTLFSGSYIDLLPAAHPGPPERHFVGLETPPVLQSDVPGRTFLLHAKRIGSISLGSPIMFRDFDVGEVLGWDIGKMARDVTIHAFVRAPFDKYVRDNSRFWNASGAKVTLGGGGVQLRVESLRAVVLGGIAFDTPKDADFTRESAADHDFTLYNSEAAADSSVYTETVPCVANFTGSVAGLAKGSPVTLHGLTIGEVTDVSLRYDRTLDNIIAPVHFRLEPERIAMLHVAPHSGVAARLQALVRLGLRVRVETANVLTGQKQLAVAFDHQASTDVLKQEDGSYVLPVSGSGSEDITTAATNLVNRLNSIPFESIGENLDQTLAGMNALVNNKQLGASIVSLRATLTSTQELIRNLNAGMTSLTTRLPDMATHLDSSLRNTDKLIASMRSGYGGNSRFSRDLTRMMMQLTDAARSIRVLADLLSRHPEALIRGRSNGVLP